MQVPSDCRVVPAGQSAVSPEDEPEKDELDPEYVDPLPNDEVEPDEKVDPPPNEPLEDCIQVPSD